MGCNKSPLDTRDYNLKNFAGPTALKISPVTSVEYRFPGISLWQGETNHCCGFGVADLLINLPVNTPCTNDDGHEFYYICKEFDGEPRNEDGSNLRSVAKTLQKIGSISNYAFAPNVATLKWWLLNKGPVVVGTIWRTNMFTPGVNNLLDIGGIVEGRHCYLVNGYIETLDVYVIQNSWGAPWGNNGKAFIKAKDFEKLFFYGGEAIAAVELDGSIKKPTSSWLEILIKFILSLLIKEK